MEKLPAEHIQQHAYPPQTFPTSIHRKPLPVSVAQNSTTVVEPPAYAHIAEDKKITEDKKTIEPQLPADRPQAYEFEQRVNSNPLPPLPAAPTFASRLKRKWTNLRKRTRYLILGAILALLILIIGLAVGLAHRASKFSNLPLPNSHGGPYTGDLTYYEPGLGACGITSSNKDFIVAVSHLVYDAVQVGGNPNSNPLCGKKIRATRGGKSVDLTVVDRCTGCKPQDLDVTITVFEGLADVDKGRVPVTWAWLQDVPGPAAAS